MIGETLSGRYEVLSELGRGGMGVVYRARDTLLSRDVAVKMIPPSLLSPESEERFQREAQLVAQMDHASIVSIYDLGHHEGSLFLVMPLLQGTTLRSFLHGGSPSLADVIDIGIEVAEALDYSHSRGVVHRDIKPENIMVWREESGKTRVRVMDFGLARAAAEGRLTKTGALVGTLAYLSPEQVAKREVDSRTDVYSLGTVLYECVVGTPPFSGEIESILYRIVHEIPQSPRTQGAVIDEEMEGVILTCLAKEPLKRPQRATEVAEALRRYRWRLRDSERVRSVVFAQTAPLDRPSHAPFIGRGKEFASLQQRLNLALSGECQFVLVAGEPGIGKTRLLDELDKLAKARKIRVLRGRSVEQDRSFPYQGFCELIQDYFRSKETGSSGVVDFSDLASDLVSRFPTLGEIGDFRSAATGLTRAEEPQVREDRTHIFELLARTLARMGGGRPLVLLLEDLHGAVVSIDALQYVVRRLGPTPTLIVGTYRSTEIDSLHPLARMLESFRGDRRFLLLSLGPLSPSEHRFLLETVLGGREVSEEVADRLYEGTAGNPFFTREMVPSLLDSGGIAMDDTGGWRLTGEALLTGALPATIHEVVERRMERLPEKLREVLSIASVMGRTFDSRALEVLAEGKGDVEDALDRLLKEGLIQEERDSRSDLAFSSGVVRDVLYAGLPRRRRRSLHRRYAEHLEAGHKDRLERVYPELVHHFTQGDVPDKTVDYGLKLARKSLEAFSPEDALRALTTALDDLEDEAWSGDRSLEGEARVLLAQVNGMLGDSEGALRETEAAARIFEQTSHMGRCASACLLAAETAWQARRIKEARAWLEKGIDAARGAEERETLVKLLTLGATVANLRGEHARAREYLEEAESIGSDARGSAGEEPVPRGGRLVVALANPVHAQEPATIFTTEEDEVLLNVFETLLATDADGNVVPSLCEGWEARDDGRAFVLTLRRDVRFQDGHTLTARDVKASFERSIRRAQPELPAAFAAIAGVGEYLSRETEEVLGLLVRADDTLEVQLAFALPIFPALLTDSPTGIVRGTGDENAPPSRLLGTGPFLLVAHDPKRVVLERNPKYWRGTSALLDAIEFRAGLTAFDIAGGLRKGQIDLARDVLPQDLDEILRDPRFRQGLVEAWKKNLYFVVFNCGGPLGRNSDLRHALAGIVHTHDLVWRTLGCFAQPAAGLIPPGILGHDPGKRREPMDREQAERCLHATGLSSPIRLEAAVHPLLQDRYSSLTKALFATWAELGVEVRIATPTMEAFLAAFERSEGIDLMVARWDADYSDPDNFTHGLFHSRNGVLRNYFSSPETDRIAEEARVEGRADVRESLYRRFENLLLESGALVPLFHDIDYRVASSKVRGLRLRASPPYVNYMELGKVESPATVPLLRSAGGIIHVPIAGLPRSLDPSDAWTIEQAEVIPNIFETLTRDVEGARIVPWLASEFGGEEEGRRFRFRLREGVRFHDGRRLTARDVRYSYERLLRDEKSERRGFLSPIRGARALIEGRAGDLRGFRIHSSTEFTIDLEEPLSFFPALIAHVSTAILPEGSDPSGGPWHEACVGTGPFRVVRFEGETLELVRNPSYWRAGYPRSDGLVFHLGMSSEAILSEFRAGRLSLASDLFPSDVEALRHESDFASCYCETPKLSTYVAVFNTRRGPLADLSLRRRLVSAVDIDALVPRTLGRLAIPAHGLIPPGLLGYDPAHLRAGAGAPARDSGAQDAAHDAIELTAAIHPVFLGEYSSLAHELRDAFRGKGVLVRTVNQTRTDYLEALRTGSVDIVLGRWEADYADADTFVRGLLCSRDGFYRTLCSSPEVDALAERGRTEPDPTVRHSLYRRVEEIIVRDVLLLPLFHEQVYRFARPEVDGLKLLFSRPAVAYESLSVRR